EGPRALSRPDVTPEPNDLASPGDDVEWEPKRRVRRLRIAVLVEEPALPALRRSVVSDEEIDEHVDGRRLLDATCGTRDVRGLPAGCNTEKRVGRVGLVPELRQPDPLRPERSSDEPLEAFEVRHRNARTPVTRRAPRRLGLRLAWIRMMGVCVEPGVQLAHGGDPRDG